MGDLVDHFRAPELGWLIDRLAVRIRRGKPLDAGLIQLRDAAPDQRRAVDDLLGRRSTSGTQLSIDLAGLCRELRLSGSDLERIVRALRGPIRNLRSERAARAAAWQSLLASWRRQLADSPPALGWLDGLERTGLLKRLAAGDPDQAQTLLRQAWTIIDAAPHPGLLLASLAAQATGDSHALDRGRPLSTLCLRAIAVRTGIDGGAGAGPRRDAWAAMGVTIDDVSAPVLCLNLSADPAAEVAPWIAWHCECGEPFYLTWRMVRRFTPDPALEQVYVCENPSIVSEAAHRLGPTAKALVCLNGLPGAPAAVLLRRLRDHGAVLHLRADFDWTGLRIVDQLHEPPHTRLWRMSADDYGGCRSSQPLTGAPYRPAWAAELAEAMAARGLAAYEEELTDVLLQDLRCG